MSIPKKNATKYETKKYTETNSIVTLVKNLLIKLLLFYISHHFSIHNPSYIFRHRASWLYRFSLNLRFNGRFYFCHFSRLFLFYNCITQRKLSVQVGLSICQLILVYTTLLLCDILQKLLPPCCIYPSF